VPDALETVAQLGVALAGFASLVSAFRERESGSLSPFYSMHLRQIVAHGLAASLLALLPLAVPEAQRADSWRWWSGVLALFWLVHLALSSRQVRRSALADPTRVRVSAALFAGAVEVCGLVSQALNFARLGLEGSFEGYLLGLVLLIFGACFSFTRMIWVSTSRSE
jgi:hypothetical protein